MPTHPEQPQTKSATEDPIAWPRPMPSPDFASRGARTAASPKPAAETAGDAPIGEALTTDQEIETPDMIDAAPAAT